MVYIKRLFSTNDMLQLRHKNHMIKAKNGGKQMNTMGKRIGELRRMKGITQDQLSDAMGVSSQAVSKWENDISCPDIGLLPGLADYLNTTIDYLVRGESSSDAKVVDTDKRKDFNSLIMKVSILSAEGDKVNVNLPMALVKMGLQMGMIDDFTKGNQNMKDIDFEAIVKMAENGAMGKIVEIQSADGDKINVTIE